jgi:hypothetical protein
LGLAVENTSEIYTTINVTLAVKQTLESLQGFLGSMVSGADDTDKNSQFIAEIFMQINNSIRKMLYVK